MDDKKTIVFSNKSIFASSSNSALIRAKSFKVNSPTHNFAQYINTIKAYALAGMPFEHIANAGDDLGDMVERGEIDAPIQEGWGEKVGETIEPDPITANSQQEQKLNVLEGIAVYNQQPQPLSNQTPNNPSLETNPFLSAPANINK